MTLAQTLSIAGIVIFLSFVIGHAISFYLPLTPIAF